MCRRAPQSLENHKRGRDDPGVGIDSASRDYRRHIDVFADRLDEALAERHLRNGVVARQLSTVTGVTIDRRRIGEWRCGSHLPPSEGEVRALEAILNLGEGTLVGDWSVAMATRLRRRPDVSDDVPVAGAVPIEREGPATTNHSIASQFEAAVSKVAGALHDVPEPWLDAVASLLMEPFVDTVVESLLVDLSRARSGLIRLSTDQYYELVLDEMRYAERGSEIIAVSTLASRLWEGEPDQLEYVDLNCRAAGNGAEIHRLFVTDRGGEVGFRAVIARQVGAGISVRVAHSRVLSEPTELDLEDCVLFRDARGRRGYVAQPARDGSGRIRFGRLVLSDGELNALETGFRRGWRRGKPQ